MASSAALELIIGVTDKASGPLGKIAGSLGTLGKIGAGAVLGGAIAGVGALSAALVTGIGDAREAAVIMAQTEAVIKSTGGAAGVTAGHIADLSGELSAASGKSLFGDSQIQESANLLLTFTNLKGGVLDAATAMSVDLAQAMGGAPADAAVQLGKALNDPVAGISALSRVGVTFTDDQKKVIQSLVDTGDVAGAQQVILAELNKEFGGSAAAAAAADGGFTMFKDRMGELAESVGAQVLPALNQLMEWLNSPEIQAGITAIVTGLVDGVGAAFSWLSTTAIPMLITGWQLLQPALAVVGEAFNNVVSVVQTVVLPILASLIAWFQGDGTAAVTAYAQFFIGIWNQIQGVIDTVVPAIQAVITTVFGAVASFLAENSGSIQNVISLAWQTIQVIVQGAMAVITGVIIPAFTAIAGFISSHGAEIQAILQTAWNLVSTIVTTALNVIQGIVRTVMAVIKGDWSGAWEEIKATAQTLWDGIKSTVEIAINAVKGVIDAVMPTIQSVIETAWESIKSAAATAWDAIRSTVETKIGEVVTLAQGLPGQIVSALSGLAGDLLSIGAAAIQGLIDGLKSIDVGSILGGIVTGAVNAAKAVAGIKSPSTKTRDELGKPMGQGIVEGIEATATSVKQAIGKTILGAIQVATLAPQATKAGKDIAEAVKTGMDSGLDDPKSVKQIFGGKLRDAVEVAMEDIKQIFGGKLRGMIEPADATGEEIGRALIAGFDRIVADFNFGGPGNLVYSPGATQSPDDSNQTKPGKGSDPSSKSIINSYVPYTSGGATNNYTTIAPGAISIMQQPGEDPRILASRVVDEIDRRNRLARTR